jgi:hypothetical protein
MTNDVISNLAPKISFYLNISEDEKKQEEAKEIIYKMFHSSALHKPPLSPTQWKATLQDALKLREKVFNFISSEWIHSLFFEKLLSSGNILLAKEHQNLVSSHTAEEKILKVAQECFNSASSAQDNSMLVAKQM